MRIHVFYRHTSVARSNNLDRPHWFSHRKCLTNFMTSALDELAQERVRLKILFDGTAEDLAQDDGCKWLSDFLNDNRSIQNSVSTHLFTGGNQRSAARFCLDNAREDVRRGYIKENDAIYLLENDYVHRPGWFHELTKLDHFRIPWDYATLYDHPDKYPNYCQHSDTGFHRNSLSKIYCTDTLHWKSVGSTCGSYVIKATTFVRDHWLLRLGLYDFKLFLILTRIFRRRLISPIPSLSTHSMNSLLAPIIQWEQIVDK